MNVLPSIYNKIKIKKILFFFLNIFLSYFLSFAWHCNISSTKVKKIQRIEKMIVLQNRRCHCYHILTHKEAKNVLFDKRILSIVPLWFSQKKKSGPLKMHWTKDLTSYTRGRIYKSYATKNNIQIYRQPKESLRFLYSITHTQHTIRTRQLTKNLGLTLNLCFMFCWYIELIDIMLCDDRFVIYWILSVKKIILRE